MASEEEEKMGGPVFNPPLYQQRYNEVIKIARRLKAKKVVDMGCAECKLLRTLKKEEYIQELVGVDYNGFLLQMHNRVVRPLTTDYLMPRENPLQCTLMQGSIAEPDARIVDFDLFSCVEVIEHLDPDVLDKVPQSVFGTLQPQVVVMTTPNADYNVLFPGFTGFRHHDHRFEWTREQFREWCDGVVSVYPRYSVEVWGVGEPLQGRESVGHCSQLALFTRNEGHAPVTMEIPTPYNIICSATHPHAQPLPQAQRLCNEAEYYLNLLLATKREHLLNTDSYYDNNHCEESDLGEEDTVCIELVELLKFPKISALCSTGEEIRDALKEWSSRVVLNSDGDSAVYPVDPEHSDTESSLSDNDDW